MDEVEFVLEAQVDPDLTDFADSIVEQVEEDKTRQGLESYDVAMAISTVVLYTLYRWIKNYFDKQKGLNDLELVREQLDLVRDELISEGVPRDKAVKIVGVMLSAIRSKQLNDTIVQSVIALISKPGNALPKL